MKHDATTAMLAASLILLGAPSARAASFTYTEISVPDAASTRSSGLPGALNDRDQIAGSVKPEGAAAEGFVWQEGVFALYPRARTLTCIDNAGVAVGLPASGAGYLSIDSGSGKTIVYRDGFRGRLVDANASGAVAAQASHAGQPVGYVLIRGAKTNVMVPGATATTPTAINAPGIVTGSYAAGSRDGGFVYSGGTYTTFAPPDSANTNPVFITNAGVIGGSFTSTIAYAPIGFVRTGGKFYAYLPADGFTSAVTGIGPGGEIVGRWEDNHIKGHGFIYRGGTFYQVDFPGASDTAIEGVNARGSLIGSFVAANGAQHVFIAQCPGGGVCTP